MQAKIEETCWRRNSRWLLIVIALALLLDTLGMPDPLGLCAVLLLAAACYVLAAWQFPQRGSR